ncbi:HNH endonuclease signature motif containing protein [Brevibacterium litoralis]|uniref:HNH endonuclease signature motif containing protein n=1 Tax=Brevibacterium litoralis TaxID=3138935 RepID=UPI0032EB3E7A
MARHEGSTTGTTAGTGAGAGTGRRTDEANPGLEDAQFPTLLTDHDEDLITRRLPELTTALDHIRTLTEDITSGHRPLDPDTATAGLAGLEQLTRRAQALTRDLTAVLLHEDVPAHTGAKNTRDLLTSKLKLSGWEAGRLLKNADAHGHRRTLTGQRLAPRRPEVASALAAGTISSAQAEEITRTLDAIPPAVETVHGPALEHLLVTQAPGLRVTDIRTAGAHALAYLDPDGSAPDETEPTEPYGLVLTRQKNGDWRLKAYLDDITGALLDAELTAREVEGTPTEDAETRDFTDPLPPTGLHPDGTPTDVRTPIDLRYRQRKNLDRLRHILRTHAGNRQAAGAAIGLVITTDRTTIERQKGLATTGSGDTVRLEHLLASDSPWVDTLRIDEVRTDTRTRTSSLVTAGRFATDTMVRALTARDQGCSFPDCSSPPSACDSHHIIPWVKGGPTDHWNLTQACGYHHHHHERLGWEAVMLPTGIVAWRPPESQDPLRRPVIHAKYRTRHLIAQRLAAGTTDRAPAGPAGGPTGGDSPGTSPMGERSPGALPDSGRTLSEGQASEGQASLPLDGTGVPTPVPGHSPGDRAKIADQLAFQKRRRQAREAAYRRREESRRQAMVAPF